MAKETKHKLEWIKCRPGEEWDVPEGWQVVTVVANPHLPPVEILVLLKGVEK